MIKGIRAALRDRLGLALRKGLDSLQVGARSTQSGPMDYAKVATLDPSRLARAYAAADTGEITEQAALFELIEEQDSHLFAEMSKRRRAVTGLGWSLTPPHDATQSEITRTEELAQIVREIPRFEDAHYDLTDAIGKGFATLEIDWKPGETWRPQALHWVPQRLFRVDRETGALQYVKNGMAEALRPMGWIAHDHRAKSGYIEQAALFRVLAWTYAYKAYNTRDMQRYLETYGQPTRVGKYPAGLAEKDRKELLRAVRNLGADQAGIISDVMKIDFIQAQTGAVTDFLSVIEYWERKQSMAILGGTLTSQADGKTSTNALGNVHNQVRREIMLHDVRQIAPTISRDLVRPIALINGMFAPDRMPVLAYQTEETVDQAKMAEVLDKGARMGLEIDVDWAHQALQIPRAAKGATILVASSTMPVMPGAALTHRMPGRVAALAGPRLAEDSPQDLATSIVHALMAQGVDVEDAVTQEIITLVHEASSFDDALAALTSWAATSRPDPDWVQTLAQALATAHLGGRAAVGTGEA